MSVAPAVIDALVSTFTATGLQTYDGPSVPTTRASEFVIVGGTLDPDDDAGTSEIEWNGLGAKHRREDGGVTCAVVVETGDTVIKPSRDRAYALLATLTTAITTDPTLGASVSSGQLLVNETTLTQRQNANGSYAQVAFTVSYQSRL